MQRSHAQLQSLGEGRFRAGGVLDASTVTGLLRESRRVFAGSAQIVVDLSAVTESDSAGLALLLEWLRFARATQQKIRFEEIPEQIMALARISEVDDLLVGNGAGDPAAVAAALPVEPTPA